MATKVVHLNGTKHLDCLLRQLQIDFVKIDKKKCASINEGPLLKGNETISGLICVAKHLTKLSSQVSLLGNNALENAEIDQWLYFCKCQLGKDNQGSLQALNEYLTDKVYFVNNRFTLADIFVYTFLERELDKFSAADKESYSNILRWVNHVQHVSKVRQKPPLLLQRTPLY